MTLSLRVVLAQLNFLVGDIEGNAHKIIQATLTARDKHQADLIAFPELALSGYPPEDLLYRADLYARVDAALLTICHAACGISIVLGYPARTSHGCYNRVSWISNQKINCSHDKQQLPNHGVFDEPRYFVPGPAQATLIDIKSTKIALLICEDLWSAGPMAQAATAGAHVVLSLNASPFALGKAQRRQKIAAQRVLETALPLLYVNAVGGQDELVFDGGSMVLDHQANKVQQAPFFTESLEVVDIHPANNQLHIKHVPLPAARSEEQSIYEALVTGLHDYVEKNAFPRAILGLSGGIDSALTLAIAVDAIGKDRVQAIMMPSRYNAEISLVDAKTQAQTLGVDYQVLPIEPVFQAFLQTLAPAFHGLASDITEENLQARCRGSLLMAISNKKSALVLATGNKSEMATGYSTLYGDMVGGICVLKDVYKTMVYKLARYRNGLSPVIPERVISRPPSAELAPHQIDQDSLPSYPLLDEILRRYIEEDQSLNTILQAGFDELTVRRVMQLVDRSEYKRRQSAPGIRISERAFGKDRRYPITSGFKPFLT